MRRRDTLKSLVGIGFGVISGVPDTYFSDWEREELDYGTHFWLRDGENCFEYKEHPSRGVVVVYTVDEDGDVGQLLKTSTQSREDAKRILSDIRQTL